MQKLIHRLFRIIPFMVFGMRGGKPSNPLDSKALGTFNFTDYGLVYASAAELEAMQVGFNT